MIFHKKAKHLLYPFFFPSLNAPYNDSFYFLKAAVRKEIDVPPTDLSSLENNLMVVRILDAAIQSAKSKAVIQLF